MLLNLSTCSDNPLFFEAVIMNHFEDGHSGAGASQATAAPHDLSWKYAESRFGKSVHFVTLSEAPASYLKSTEYPDTSDFYEQINKCNQITISSPCVSGTTPPGWKHNNSGNIGIIIVRRFLEQTVSPVWHLLKSYRRIHDEHNHHNRCAHNKPFTSASLFITCA